MHVQERSGVESNLRKQCAERDGDIKAKIIKGGLREAPKSGKEEVRVYERR